MAETARVNGLIGTLGIKAPVRAATTANVTLSGEQTIDGVALAVGDRVLVKDQTTASENGVYYVETGAWTRAPDFDGPRDVTKGTMVCASEGTANANVIYRVTTTGEIVFGSTAITFAASAFGGDIAARIHDAANKVTPVGADEFGIWDSVSGALNRLSITNLAALCSAGWNAATATLAALATSANRVDSGIVAIASHATTADIFAAAANTIDWTGTATTTAFPAAPKAGMTRTLYCAGACAFTAGANLLIEGFGSGQTATMAAGAIVTVTAITTTQFKITYSLSGNFTITATVGFTTTPSTTAYYSVVNGVVSLRIIDGGITGTSNATTLRLSGLPAAIAPANAKKLPIMEGVDNGTSTYISASVLSSGGLIDLFKGFFTGAWTASGTKTLYTSEFTYHLG